MSALDLTIFVAYVLVMLGIGFFFHRKNTGVDDYYVGGRSMGSLHVGLSVVATDVGGGFSVGLGGLGFAIGLSGSWLLFSGLIGAWLSAVLLIPRVKQIEKERPLLTFPEVFDHYFGRHAALWAALISAIGYLGFTSSQILAGSKLASATFPEVDSQASLIAVGSIAVIYTAMGGLKAVIYTDTVQWSILLVGLLFVAMPLGYTAVGGWEGIRGSVDPRMLALDNLSWQTFVNWMITIVPVWFVAMTLFQRIYASRDERSAKRAWFFAGLLEWPLMAFAGVVLGLFARVAAEQGMFAELGFSDPAVMDPETGLPVLLRTILPIGLLGLVLSAYFSAILSTADSCLMAASGNVVSDLVGQGRSSSWARSPRRHLRLSQLATLVLGILAILIASQMGSVLELMLYSYAFMVSGLFVPMMAALIGRGGDEVAAVSAMILGGSTTVLFIVMDWEPAGLDANLFGIVASLVTYGIASTVRGRDR